MSEARGLHDMASKVARLRLRLRALQPPSIPGVSTVCELLDELADIATTANLQLTNCSEFPSRDEKIALFAYCYALDPLGEYITEIGRVNAAVMNYHFQTKSIQREHAPNGRVSDSRAALKAAWKDASEYLYSGCEVADAFLKTLEGDLLRTAMSLAPPADSPPLIAPNSRQNLPGTTSIATSAPSATATAKGR